MILTRPRILIEVTFLKHFALEVWVSIVPNRHDEEERAGCFAIFVFLMSCDCKSFVALPHGAAGWSVVSDCGIS